MTEIRDDLSLGEIGLAIIRFRRYRRVEIGFICCYLLSAALLLWCLWGSSDESGAHIATRFGLAMHGVMIILMTRSLGETNRILAQLRAARARLLKLQSIQRRADEPPN